MTEMVPITCAITGETREVKPRKDGTPRLPKGWRRLDGVIYSQAAWRDRYAIRAVTLPVAGPVDDTWDDLRPTMKRLWRSTTALSNWLSTELYARDVRRHPDGPDTMPAMDVPYLYPEARQRFPDLPSTTVAALCQQVTAKYRAVRYGVIWTCTETLPTYRYPTPVPIPAQAWNCQWGNDRVPLVHANLGGHRWTLRLRGGSEFRRQLRVFDLITQGRAVGTEMVFMQKRLNTGDHRVGIAARQRLLCKIVAWIPKPDRNSEQAEGRNNLYVRTESDALLVAVDAQDQRVWRYHGDHLRRATLEHRDRLQRWADDTKAEMRPAPFAQRRRDAARKYRNRMDTATHTIAHSLVQFAVRRRCGTIVYDDRDRSFVVNFPYYQLHQRIIEKAHMYHIDVRAAESSTDAPDRSHTPDAVS